MKKVFLSYSHVDSETADAITEMMTECGADCFRDTKDIEWGQSISNEVRSALRDSTAMLVIVSPASLKSHWVPYEIGFGSALGIRILPYLTHPSLEVPHYIRDLNFVTRLEQVREFLSKSQIQDIGSKHQEKAPPTLTKASPELVFKDGVYFTESGEGPFCTGCFDSGTKLIRLVNVAEDFRVYGDLKCPVCRNYFGEGSPPTISEAPIG